MEMQFPSFTPQRTQSKRTTRKKFSLSRAAVLVNLMMMLLHFLIFLLSIIPRVFLRRAKDFLFVPELHEGKLFALRPHATTS
jgi:hypothetical protein